MASTRTTVKRQAILEAAIEVFLAHGYSAGSMDEITTAAGVSKQTVYVYFRTKEALFAEAVRAATGQVQQATPPVPGSAGAAAWLEEYAYRQLTAALDPNAIRLRRLAIGEAERFPELARDLFEQGPQRAVTALAGHLRALRGTGHLHVDDAYRAAQELTWLIMGEPVNRAMLLGTPVGDATYLRRHAREAADTFLAAYGVG